MPTQISTEGSVKLFVIRLTDTRNRIGFAQRSPNGNLLMVNSLEEADIFPQSELEERKAAVKHDIRTYAIFFSAEIVELEDGKIAN